MKLKDQIMSLHDGIRSTREIADLVYGALATAAQVTYVRVVTRQRKGASYSKYDLRYRSVAINMAALRVGRREVERTGDKIAANAAAREARLRIRQAGGSSWDGHLAAVNARNRMLYKTGDRIAGMQAAREAREAARA